MYIKCNEVVSVHMKLLIIARNEEAAGTHCLARRCLPESLGTRAFTSSRSATRSAAGVLCSCVHDLRAAGSSYELEPLCSGSRIPF